MGDRASVVVVEESYAVGIAKANAVNFPGAVITPKLLTLEEAKEFTKWLIA